jgi:ferredoxin/flavodoxin---NADP+ reductase
MRSKTLKVAVIGAGPSGFYAVRALIKLCKYDCEIDIIDRLPTPYGLVRGGVAPDHQNIKRIVKSYERLLKDERVRFVGNVQLGKDIEVSELEQCYNAIIYATGNESARKMGIPGEDLDGVHSATEFVFWYNGHPDYTEHVFRLEDAQRVAVIGNGNVSVDVARILAKNPNELADTDISEHALDVLHNSPLKEVLMLGRRGPAQAAFSLKEVQELSHVNDVDLVVDQENLTKGKDKFSMESIEKDPAAQRIVRFLEEQSAKGDGESARKIRAIFLTSPIEFIGENGKLTHVKMVRNELVEKDGRIRPTPTGESWTQEVQLVFKAIGYRGVPIPGVPFDDWKGIIPNVEGRVHDSDGKARFGQYVVGWAKRGPSGLIGTNRPDSESTVERLLEDVDDLIQSERENDLKRILMSRGVRVVDEDDWFYLDSEESRRGELKGKIRDKFCTVEEMLKALESRRT